jgi:YVTN family beta-propeller protein
MLILAACGGSTAGGSKAGTLAVGRLAATITLGEVAQRAAFGAQGIWFLNALNGLAAEVDPSTNRVVATINVGSLATNLIATPEMNALWVTQDDGKVRRIDLGTGQVVATIPISTAGVYALTATASPPALWVAAVHDHAVTRIDTRTNQVVATIDVGESPEDIEAAQGAVWVCNLKDDHGVQQIDPQTNQVTTRVTLNYSNFGGIGCGSIRFTTNALWVMTYEGTIRTTVLLRLDPTTFATVARIDLGGEYLGFNIGADANGVWVPDIEASNLVRVDATTNRVMGKLTLSERPNRATFTAGAVWVSSQYNNPDTFYQNAERTGETLWRITPAP